MVVNEAGKNRSCDFYGVGEAGFTLLFSYLRFASRFFFLLLKLIGNVFRFAQKPAFDGSQRSINAFIARFPVVACTRVNIGRLPLALLPRNAIRYVRNEGSCIFLFPDF